MNPAELEAAILFEQRGSLGVVVLNRPKAVNALTAGMCELMLAQLQSWAVDDAIDQVLVYGNGDRGLCAGGDIVAIYRDALDQQAGGGNNSSAAFWATEYRLNSLISRYPKPYIAFMDGLVLGGGVGISAHGSHRLVTERTRCGMPETTIGFVPDVGGTFLLSRAPGETGTHAALTGSHLAAADVLFLGMADEFVPSERLSELALALESEPVDEVLPRFVAAAPASALQQEQQLIDEAYAAQSVEQILSSLRSVTTEDQETAAGYAQTIESKSPTALKVALASLRRSRELSSLEEALDQEYRVGLRLLAGHDMAEGIRAQVIDKDRNPQWQPASLAEVSDSDVESYFVRNGEHELGLAAAVQS
ncbi:3-hydroxyisobutyryl-CoA hydrolase [Psychromicrobium lacuslunae]|uniref:3-hydroxyisobutyryl-CoA hydrolase n=1 Tax=Psychromicrobium lacuslunae TaxID=1618207 RepID=A0A0D4C3H7_9MICC|nr:3-hydroxyisobutyryl-CoA hydrolase [Psychromicrobium lacuslunae]